jgi:hypothetical protein
MLHAKKPGMDYNCQHEATSKCQIIKSPELSGAFYLSRSEKLDAYCDSSSGAGQLALV